MVAATDARDRSPLLRYGSAEEAQEALPIRSLVSTATTGPLRLSARTLFFALNGTALLVLLSLCVSMHGAISRLEAQTGNVAVGVASQTDSVEPNTRGAGTVDAVNFAGKDGRVPMALLPSKFAVDYVTPRQDQAYRGTCWDFATIGFLEQSYREHGVSEGWLAADEYVAFSEQAYGVEVLKLCTGDVDSTQQVDCRVAGDEVHVISEYLLGKKS